MANITAEVHLSYDYDMSSINFNENFEKLEFDNSKWQYIEWGNIRQQSLADLVSIAGNNRKNSLALAMEELGIYYEDLSRDEMLVDIYYGGNGLDEFITALENNGISYKEHFIEVITRGYSQGDYAEVIIPTKALRECWGTPKRIKDDDIITQEQIDNYFWDAPVFLRIDLDLNNTQVEINGWDMDVPAYWNYPYDVDDAKKLVKACIEKQYQHVAAKDKIVEAVMCAFPSEVKTPNY